MKDPFLSASNSVPGVQWHPCQWIQTDDRKMTVILGLALFQSRLKLKGTDCPSVVTHTSVHFIRQLPTKASGISTAPFTHTPCPNAPAAPKGLRSLPPPLISINKCHCAHSKWHCRSTVFPSNYISND